MQLFKKWNKTTCVVVPDGYVMWYSNDGSSIHLLDSDNNDVELGGGSGVTVDTALSATSTNPVQNKVIKTELDKKASASEVYSKTEIDNKFGNFETQANAVIGGN